MYNDTQRTLQGWPPQPAEEVHTLIGPLGVAGGAQDATIARNAF